jgi:hypothetical protein
LFLAGLRRHCALPRPTGTSRLAAGGRPGRTDQPDAVGVRIRDIADP